MSSLFEEISNIHRYLSRQLLYPILLSTLLAVSLYAARVFFSRAFAYDNLVWNLYLAWLPYVFALTAGLLNFMLPRSWWLLIVPGILWLAARHFVVGFFSERALYPHRFPTPGRPPQHPALV